MKKKIKKLTVSEIMITGALFLFFGGVITLLIWFINSILNFIYSF
jgi:hypothetical protein